MLEYKYDQRQTEATAAGEKGFQRMSGRAGDRVGGSERELKYGGRWGAHSK